MISKNLVKKSGVYFVGNLSSKIMSALLIPIYAFSVSVNDLGTYDFYQTIMGVLSPLIVLAIWEGILRFILIEDDVRVKRKILTTSAIFTIVMSISFLLVFIILFLKSSLSLEYYPLILLMIVLHTMVYVWQYTARAYNKNKLYVLAGISGTIVNFVLIIVLVVIFKMGLLGLLISYNMSQLVIILVIESRIAVLKNIKISDFDFSILKKMIMFSSPLVLNLISAWMIAGFGRLIVTIRLGSEENGLYSFAIKFSLIITMVGTVITMAIIEEAIIAVKNKKLDSNFYRTLESLFNIFQSLILIAIPVIVIFYYYLSETDYYDSLIYVPCLLIYAVANTMASNLGSVFQAIDKTKYQFFTTIVGAFVTIILSFYLIDKIGIMGVVLGQAFGAITMLICRYILINKFVSIKINWAPIISRSLAFLIVSIFCMNSSIIICALIELFLITYLIIRHKEIIFKLLTKIKRKLVNK